MIDGYQRWAYEEASPSLLKVAQRLGKTEADALILNAFLSSGRRLLISSDAIIKFYTPAIMEGESE